jgi:hypothetical protein
MNQENINELKKTFKDTIYGFFDTCIPLGEKDNSLYFLSLSGQLYGFDKKNKSFFEPNSTNKYILINNCINIYFTKEIKKSLEETVGINFDDLVELILRATYKEKHIGKKFFYSREKNIIFVWNMVTTKWETAEIDKLKHFFSNNEILQDDTKVYKSSKVTSFEDLEIDMDDLEEISARFRDSSIHYYHKDQNKIYSLNYIKNYWYIPEENLQKSILSYVAKNSVEDHENLIDKRIRVKPKTKSVIDHNSNSDNDSEKEESNN